MGRDCFGKRGLRGFAAEIRSLQIWVNMLLFLKKRKHEFPQNISKLNEQESTFADYITENSPKEELLFYKQKNRSRTKKDCSLSMAEREVPVQMEDGLGEVQSR